MVIILRIFLLGCLVVPEISCTSVDSQKVVDWTHPPESGGISPSANQILITFEDERNQRVPIADAVSGYRQRGDYANSTWSLNVAEALAKDYGLRQVTQWPINSLGIHCVVYEIPVNLSMEQVLKRLEMDKRIEAVQAMKTFHVRGETYTDPYFKLQTGIRDMHVESAQRIATGRNIKVAVIDTGVDVGHPDLTGQIALEQNFVDESKASPDDIHGTAVAGIIAASANNQMGIVGIAPDAKLIVLKACWQISPQKAEAVCNSLTLALALNSAINLKSEIINLSLTGPQDTLVGRLVDKALDDGIIVVASTSSPFAAEKDFPSSIKRVIAVRTANAVGNSSPSDTGIVPAPGQEILTTLPHATYNFMSGSSFAAAHISGVIALLLQLNPHLGSEQILSMLQASMSPSTSAQAVNTVNACVAVASLSGSSDCGNPTVRSGSALLASPSVLMPDR
ncbi:MAG: serine protease [Candidatus Methylumidiphilus alinenensis]|uniref:Serine protease n=1 Tax=Candidatus Methylumidiphilus alinenensis TaxID=2202197 RepID=A0A2W4R206_9GAMM|nr:MAG: serine protease [Candidatus Methylumidiphilus alinenensis]